MKQAVWAVGVWLALASSAAAEIPEKAVCVACELSGSCHGVEKVVAHREYEGETYYFCSKKCAEGFDTHPQAYIPPVLPRPAPVSSLTGLDGEEIALADYEGGAVLIDFWATWCKPCLQAMPKLQQIHNEIDDLTVIGVSIDSKDAKDVAKFVKKKKLEYPVALDAGEDPAWWNFHVAVIPAMFLLDPAGQDVAQWTGSIDLDEVRRVVERVVAAPVAEADQG